MRTGILRRLAAPSIACALTLLAGCASNPANSADPYEKSNRFFYRFNDALDRCALKPVSDVYVKIIPRPIRASIANGFDNLTYGEIIVNDFLQAQWVQGLGDVGRMAVNSTIGVAGLVDIATPLGLPSHDNDFGVTLGKWGVAPGRYLVIPFYGPSTLRDVADLPMQYVTNPIVWIDPPWAVSIPLSALGVIDTRSRNENWVKFRDLAALDPYVFVRNAYLQYRQSQIGRPTTGPSLYDEDADSTPATRPDQNRSSSRP